MPQVKDLIKDASWTTAKGFENLKPEVSILIPTYRRGDNGLFRQCVETILNQSFKNLELIIIDDASYDTTGSQIKEFMKKDKRIACIRHVKNVGLPAISIFEGYMKARSNKIFFAFDDNEYFKDAVKITYEHQKNNPEILVSYSVAKAKTKDGDIFFGTEDLNYNKLVAYNYIPNGGMMVDKKVIEDIGWYDPHICITRLCDWDLLIRISRKYKIYRIDKVLSLEKGIIQLDSLGNTHHLEHQLITEWMNINRNQLLQPKNFLNYDVISTPSDLSYLSKSKMINLICRKFPRFLEYQEIQEHLNSMKNTQGGYILIFDEYNASTELYFSNLPENIRKKLIILSDLNYYYTFFLDLILNAKAVIFSRKIQKSYLKVSNTLKITGVPYYYYTDDNFFIIYPKDKNKNNYNFLKNANGIMFSTEELCKYFKKLNLNRNLMIVNPSLSPTQNKENRIDLSHFKSTQKTINIVIASTDRYEAFKKLKNEIKQLAKNYSLNIYIFKNKKYANLKKSFYFDNVNIQFLNVEYNHNVFINLLKNKKIHFFLHPADKNLKNYQYKTLHFLINAYLTSSLVLVPDVFPYNELKKDPLLKNLIISKSDNWAKTLENLIKNPDLTKQIFKKIENFCSINFNYDNKIKTFSKIFEDCPDVDLLKFSERINKFNKAVFFNKKVFLLKKTYDKLPSFMKRFARIGFRILQKAKNMLRK